MRAPVATTRSFQPRLSSPRWKIPAARLRAHWMAGGADRRSMTRTVLRLAILPAYAKSHSQGEYVFDQGWADAWERAGGSILPKATNRGRRFSPVPGPRLLLRDPSIGPALIAAAEAVVVQHE
jgi:predicted N-acyltransferase